MMKYLVVFTLIFIPFVSACNKENETDLNTRIRKIAWNSLSEKEKSTVITDWQKAPVNLVTYEQQDAYAVTFNTTEDALLGPIVVYIDKDLLVVTGRGLRL